jgi:hypothetical protein
MDSENTYLMGLLMAYRQYDDTIVLPFNRRARTDIVFKPPFPKLAEQIRDAQRLWGISIDSTIDRKEFELSSTVVSVHSLFLYIDSHFFWVG